MRPRPRPSRLGRAVLAGAIACLLAGTALGAAGLASGPVIGLSVLAGYVGCFAYAAADDVRRVRAERRKRAAAECICWPHAGRPGYIPASERPRACPVHGPRPTRPHPGKASTGL